VCISSATGTACSPVNPCGHNYPYGCPTGYQCVNTTNEGLQCRIPTTNTAQCSAANPCTIPNSNCHEGTCVCNSGYGGTTCNSLGCTSDSQCPVNGYCVLNHDANTLSYCHCKPGWTGLQCGDAVNNACNPTSCPQVNAACNNAGQCVCAPGFSGDNCNVNSSAIACAITITITCKPPTTGPLTAAQVKIILASIMKIDISNIIVTGPTATAGGNVQYSFNLCSSTGDVNTNLAAGSFFSAISSGQDGGLGVTNTGTNPAPNTSQKMAISVTMVAALIYSIM